MADTHSERERSTFVTVVAWIFIVLAGFASAIVTLQNIMFRSFLSQTGSPPIQVPADPNIPPFAGFMLNHMQLFFLAFLVVSVTTFVTSIALLRRSNWARLVFIGIMALGIIWNLLGLVLTFTTFKNLPNFSAAPNMPDMNAFRNAMIAFNVALAVGLSGLFTWIIKRLVSEGVRAEFT